MLKRFVTYINQYDRGNRGSNAGFVKTDIRDAGCRMEIQLRGLDRFQGKAKVYLIVFEENAVGIPAGELLINQGAGRLKLAYARNILGASGYSVSQIQAVVIRYGSGKLLVSLWSEQVPEELLRGKFAVWGEPASEGAEQATPEKEQITSETEQITSETEQTTSKTEQTTSKAEQTTSKAESVPAEMENTSASAPEAAGSDKASAPDVKAPEGTPVPRTEALASTSGIEMPASASSAEAPASAPSIEAPASASSVDVPASASSVEAASTPKEMPELAPSVEMSESASDAIAKEKAQDDTAREALPKESVISPRTQVPDAAGISPQAAGQDRAQAAPQAQEAASPQITYKKIAMADIRSLPKRNWYLCNNSFLIHGFFNYHYLILKTVECDGQKKCYLGVPGIYEQPERMMAIVFGFPVFEPAWVGEASPDAGSAASNAPGDTYEIGVFGYWMLPLMN